MKYKRHIEQHLEDALEDTPVVLLNGPRQSGKSTLVKYLSKKLKNSEYITLDDYTALAAAQRDPEAFINHFEGSVVIGEVQRAPGLFLAIKKSVDENRVPGRFLLTGSANVLLLPHLSDSLAGRIEVIPLYPLSISEVSEERENLIDQFFDQKKFTRKFFRKLPSRFNSFAELLAVGGFPEAIERNSPARIFAWHQSYLTTILSRDVKELAAIEGLSAIPDLVAMLAARSGTLLNFAELSRSAGLPMTTLKRYFQLLETLFLVHTVPAWSRNHSKRLVKAPKLFLTDTGVQCHLLGMDIASIKNSTHQLGRIVETFVVNECLKSLSWCHVPTRLFHYRTTSGHEVDCVLESFDGRIVGIEVKSAAKVSINDCKGLEDLRSAVGDKFVRGIILYQGEKVIALGEKIIALPIMG